MGRTRSRQHHVFNETAARLRKQDTSRNYDEDTLKILWATSKTLTMEEYDRQHERKRSRQVAKSVFPTKVLIPPAPTPSPSSHVDGGGVWPDKPSFKFMSGIRDEAEQHAYGLWAG